MIFVNPLIHIIRKKSNFSEFSHDRCEEKFEVTNGVIKSRKSKKDQQTNGQI